MSASELLDRARDYLSEPRCAIVATLAGDGSPRQAVVHYALAEDHLLVNGRTDRLWCLNLQRDPRVSLVVHDVDEPLHWFGLSGTAEVAAVDQEAVEHAVRLALRYSEDPEGYRTQERISFRIVPERVFERLP
jgi:PPOX class probable F420-dependent enzyme